MAGNTPIRIRTISEFHKLRDLPKPEHPLVSVVDVGDIKHGPKVGPKHMVFEFYSIAMKRNFSAKLRYGQQQYDFDEGTMFFMSPGQVFGVEIDPGQELKQSGWMVLVHPDFLWNTPLA